MRTESLSSKKEGEEGRKNIQAIVLFPTPPFPLATARTFLTFGIGLLTIGPAFLGICGGSGRLGRPCDPFSVNYAGTSELRTRGFSWRR